MKKTIVLTFSVLLASFGMQVIAQESTSEIRNSLHVWIDDLTLTADGETVSYLHISENDEIDYTAFQMRINVPQGIRLEKVKIGRNQYDALPTDRFTASHTVTCNLVDEGQSIKIAVMSPSNELLFSDDENGEPLDELCAIALTADKSMYNGTYSITMEDVKFILPSSFAYIPETTSPATMTIVGGQEPTSIINDVNVDEQGQIYYDLFGRKVVNPSHGVFIKENKKIIIK